MWHGPHVDKPKAGTRIIAPYSDGSGAVMFIVLDDGQGGVMVIDQDGEEYSDGYLQDADFGLWAYMPEGTKLWCEVRADDPITV